MIETLKKTCGLIQLSQAKVSSEVGVGVLYGEWLQPPRHLLHLAMRERPFLINCCSLLIAVPCQIPVQVDDVSLHGKNNQQAVEILKQTGPVVRLKVARHVKHSLSRQQTPVGKLHCT